MIYLIAYNKMRHNMWYTVKICTLTDTLIKNEEERGYSVDFENLTRINNNTYINTHLLNGYLHSHFVFNYKDKTVSFPWVGIKEDDVISVLMNKELLGI